MSDKDGIYARAADRMRELLPELKGVRFTSADLWQRLNIQNRPEHRPFKDALAQVLYNWSHELKKATLRQDGKFYSVIDREFKVVEWWKGNAGQPIDIKWPRGVEDDTSFGFGESINVYRGDTIGLAGESNKGKTTFCLNFGVENMDNFDVTIVQTENIARFEQRISSFDFVDIWKPDGTPKFELIEQHQDFEYLVAERPDNLIIIDWIDMPDEPWKMGQLFQRIGEKLNNGVCLISLQKRSYKDYGVGGESSQDYAGAYFSLSFERLRVIKAKAPKAYDPNGNLYRFKIVQNGSRFHDIAEIRDCPKCKGKKYYNGAPCERCMGLGYLEVGDMESE